MRVMLSVLECSPSHRLSIMPASMVTDMESGGRPPDGPVAALSQEASGECTARKCEAWVRQAMRQLGGVVESFDRDLPCEDDLDNCGSLTALRRGELHEQQVPYLSVRRQRRDIGL